MPFPTEKEDDESSSLSKSGRGTEPGAGPANNAEIKKRALAAGFALTGLARVPENGAAPGAEFLNKWLAAGKHGPIKYISDTVATRMNLRQRYPWARAVLCVAAFYDGFAKGEKGRDFSAHVARYARGRDYHKIFERRLKALARAFVEENVCTHARAYVDTGPILERSWAELAGLGWTGKNTCLIHPRLGSYMLLGEILLSAEIEPDPPATDHCGTCRRCLDACPTGALSLEHGLDANRCIVTWNLEMKGDVPAERWPEHHGWAAGCDVCQEVCPYNRPASIPQPDAELADPLPWQNMTLAQAILMSEAEYDHAFQASALRRTGWKGLRLGAITAAGNVLKTNQIANEVRAPLVAALRECVKDADKDIRARAEWALQY